MPDELRQAPPLGNGGGVSLEDNQVRILLQKQPLLDQLIGRYSNLGYVGILVLRKPSMSLPSASTCGARAA
jgi:hypothetical protein